MARYGYGMSVSGTRALGQAVASPIPSDGLSLWLKADAGVTKFSYNYASTIVISGTSNPSFAGTYTADSVPTYNAEENQVNDYNLSGSEGRSIAWIEGDSAFVLSSTESAGSFVSGDGANWSAFNSFVSQVIITGFTGIYSGANGTYNGNGSYFTRVGGGFDILNNELRNEGQLAIATAPANYSGSWTPTTYISSVTLTGAGTTVVNGVYTRTDSEIDESEVTFFGSGGKNLYWNGDDWVAQSANEENAYYLSDIDLITWTVGEFTEGTAPAPTGATATSARSVGSPTSTSVTVPTGSISGSVTTTTVESVTGWADQSGNGRDFANWYSIPSISSISGKTFVSFDLDTALLNTSNVIWPNTGSVDYGTIITVARFPFSQPSGSNPSYIFNHGGILYIARGSDQAYPDGINATKDNDTNAFGNSNLSNNTNYLIGMTFNLDSLTLYLNGTVNGSGSGFENTSDNEMSIGYSPSQPFSIAEIVVYNRVLSTPERQQVEAYLNAKYAIY